MAEVDLYQEADCICSICLCEFSKPVSTPCGHNFCMSCINKHFQNKMECPSCRRRFPKGLKLDVNTDFRAVVENLKKLKSEEIKEFAVKGEVLCDTCPGVKLKAVKTCLDCMVSFCRKHVGNHWTHQLLDPVQNLEKKKCKKHGRRLEFFCWNDEEIFCELCSEHRQHHTVPLEDEYRRMKAQMVTENLEVKELLQGRVKKFQEMKAADQREKQDTNEAVMSCIHTLAHLSGAIQLANGKLLREIHERHVAVQRPAAVLLNELQNEIAELERKSFRLECLTNIEDPLQMMRSWSTFPSSAPQTSRQLNINIQNSHIGGIRKALDELEEMLTGEMERAGQAFRICCRKILVEKPLEPTQTITDLESVPEGIRMDVIRQQYEVDVTIDPCTASDTLLMSSCCKEVQTSHIWWINGRARTFIVYAYVLGKNVFSAGRVYFQVSAEMKTGWDLGVARESVRGNMSLTPSVKNGTWVIRLRNNTKLQALENKPVNIPLPGKLEKIGVFVDYEERLVSFYDASVSRLMYSFTGCDFNESVLPFFSPCPSDGGVNDAPLVLSSPYTGPKTAEPTEEPPPGDQLSEDSIMSCVITVFIVIFIAFLRQMVGI